MRWLLTPRTLVIALLVALALNLFLGSVIAGHWLGSRPRGWTATALVERRAERLAAPDAAILRAAFAARQGELEGRFKALKIARGTVLRAVEAEPFDTAVLAEALAEIRVRAGDLQEDFHALYLEIAPRLSAAGRRALFERRRDRE